MRRCAACHITLHTRAHAEQGSAKQGSGEPALYTLQGRQGWQDTLSCQNQSLPALALVPHPLTTCEKACEHEGVDESSWGEEEAFNPRLDSLIRAGAERMFT